MPIRVAVAGALGRMGRVATAALESDRSGEFEYVGGVARAADAERSLVTSIDALEAFAPDVLLDLTVHPASVALSMAAVAVGIRPVIGATGWSNDERLALREAVDAAGIGAMLVPNFSFGAALMMRFARDAARVFAASEIVELHHDRKLDAPSGTAKLTADLIERSGERRPPIHSVRLPGLLAHQEVLFGGAGELLTLRHDSLAREAFVPGMLAAIRSVTELSGLEIGLDALLDEVLAR